ncbi:MAG: nucleotidyltransferase [Actinomycetota bacterium]
MAERLEALSLPEAEPGPDAAPPTFEKQTVDEPVFLDVLKDVIGSLEREDIPFLVIGGVASAVWGRPRYTQDIDVLVRTHDAKRALQALAGAGFATEETYEHWLYKGLKNGVIVDVLFQSSGGIYLDEEMQERREVREVDGMKLPLASAEDIIVMKAIAHEEATPRYWHDALGIIARTDLDWDYLLQRARVGARRILALLLYAQSNDLVVPDRIVRELIDTVQSTQPIEGESRDRDT